MLWLWILLGIIAFFVLINILSITLAVYADNDKVYLDAKYAFLRMRIYPEKQKKPKKEKIKKKKDKPINNSSNNPKETAEPPKSENQKESLDSGKKAKKAEKEKKPKKKKGLSDLRELLQMLDGVPSLIGKLIKRIRIENLYIHIESGKDDAYETAMNFGKLNAGIWTLVGMLCGIFTVDLKEIEIVPRFNEDVFEYRVKALIKLRIYHIIIIALRILFKVFITNKRKGDQNAHN